MFRPLDEVQADLAHVEPVFHAVVAGAWARYGDLHQGLRGDYNPRIQANLVHGYMEAEARRLLADEPGIEMPPMGAQGFHFDYEWKYRIKPRKLNRDFSVCNNSTRMALEFVDQPEQLSLAEMPDPLTKLHLGYRLNLTRSAMASAHVVCPNGVAGYHWEWRLQPPQDAQEPARLPGPQRGPRVRPKETVRPVAAERQDGTAS